MLIISKKIRAKLAQVDHGVTEEEIVQAFEDRQGGDVYDDREEHRTWPPTRWFVGETNRGRKLKVVYVFENGDIYIKSAYTATEVIQSLYKQKQK